MQLGISTRGINLGVSSCDKASSGDCGVSTGVSSLRSTDSSCTCWNGADRGTSSTVTESSSGYSQSTAKTVTPSGLTNEKDPSSADKDKRMGDVKVAGAFSGLFEPVSSSGTSGCASSSSTLVTLLEGSGSGTVQSVEDNSRSASVTVKGSTLALFSSEVPFDWASCLK